MQPLQNPSLCSNFQVPLIYMSSGYEEIQSLAAFSKICTEAVSEKTAKGLLAPFSFCCLNIRTVYILFRNNSTVCNIQHGYQTLVNFCQGPAFPWFWRFNGRRVYRIHTGIVCVHALCICTVQCTCPGIGKP
jgi:hypothetical protein